MDEKKYTFENREYRDTYRHSTSHVLAQAVKRLYPEGEARHRPGHRERILLRHRLRRHLHSGDTGEDRGGDAPHMQGEAAHRAL